MELKNKWQSFRTYLSELKVGKTNLEDILTKILIFVFFIVLIPLLFSSNKSGTSLNMKKGSIAPKKVVAPFNFFILKTKEELKKERDENAAKVPFYFSYNDSITRAATGKLHAVISYILNKNIPVFDDVGSNSTADSFFTVLKNELQEQFLFNFSSGSLQILSDIFNDPKRLESFKEAAALAEKLEKEGILSLSLAEINRPNVVVRRKGIEEPLAPQNRRDLPAVNKVLENKLLESFDVNQALIINYFFAQILTPNLIYEQKFTRAAVEQAIAEVAVTKDMVYENERIVDANERIDADIFQKLYSLKAAQIERGRREGGFQDIIAYLAKMMLLAAVLLIAGLYLFSFRKKIFNNNKMLFMISLILMLEFVLAALISGPLNWHTYVIPVTIVSMLLAILVDSGIAFVATVVVALVLGGIQGGGYDIALMTMVSGMVAIFSVHKMRTRNQVFKAIVFIAAAYLWVLITLTALRYDSLLEASKIFVYFLLPNAVLSPFLTFMLLGVFEKLFDITTDVTLLELSDMNHPLLKKLAMEAPGTFHHSMVVGNLAERAAKAIGANSLLARVGSYYHDVGKMEKPEYFVENQMDADNRHTQLAASMSALILTSHVKNGIEMAAAAGIPKRIRDFIPEHHGTSTMDFFYKKALENAGETQVNEADFRYQGPKPQSRETAIVMLADSVEAATRSIKNPTPNKIRAFVEELVDKKFRMGELDECDLTLRDLKQIVDAFMPVLYGVFQHRIEYPDQENKKGQSKPRSKNEKNDKNGHSNSSGASKNTAEPKAV